MGGAQCGDRFKMCLEFPSGLVVRNPGFQCHPARRAARPKKKRDVFGEVGRSWIMYTFVHLQIFL